MPFTNVEDDYIEPGLRRHTPITQILLHCKLVITCCLKNVLVLWKLITERLEWEQEFIESNKRLFNIHLTSPVIR